MLNIIVISEYFLDLLISFTENYIIILSMELFFYKKKNYSIITAVFFTIISIFVNNIFFPPILSSFVLLFLIYGYVFLFLEGKLSSKIIVPLLAFANLFIINMTITSIYMLFSINPNAFISSLNFDYFMISIFQKIILFLEYILLKKHIYHDIYLTNVTWILSITLVGISMIFPIIFYNEYLNATIKDFYIVSASLIEFIIINILIYCILINTSNDHNKIIEQQLLLETEKYESQMCAFIEKRIKELNKLNHDMHNHMLVIKKLSENNKNNEVDNYINNIVSEISPSYVNTSNNILNYLLNEKIKTAQELNIDIKCLIQGDLKTTISSIDLSIVIGNLLDNAIEGAKKSNNKYININIVQDIYKLIISVTNSFDGKINKHGDMFISTKLGDLHGYGILNVQQVCQKYNGNNFINIDGKKFSHVCSFLLFAD